MVDSKKSRTFANEEREMKRKPRPFIFTDLTGALMLKTATKVAKLFNSLC